MDDARQIVVYSLADNRGCREDQVLDDSRFAETQGEFDYLCVEINARGVRELGLTWEANAKITVGEVIAIAVLLEDEAA